MQSLNEGTKLWGAVSEILSKELIISLPHGLRGHVAYKDASDVLSSSSSSTEIASSKKAISKSSSSSSSAQLSDLFHVGQLVRCVVSRLRTGKEEEVNKDATTTKKQDSKTQAQRKRVDITLHVAKVNSGLGGDSVREGAALSACVKSVEDHGYLLTFGIKNTTGFLPKADSPTVLRVGSVVDVVVCSVKSGGHAIVSAEAAAVAAATTKEWDGLNIGTLVPGALVNARVRHVLSDGLLVSFLTFFTGTIDPFHLGPIKNAADGWKSQFSENQRIKARILFVDPASKRVGLTLQRHLLDWSVLSDFPAQGQIFPAAVVKRVDPNLGLLLDLEAPAAAAAIEENDDDEDDNTDKKIITSSTATNIYGYAHISNLADEKIDKVENRYRPGQVVNVRVIGVRPMDGLVAVSLKSSVLEQSFLNVNDVAPGMKVSGTVVRSEEGMLLIALTSHLKALVPALHMSDLASSKAHKKYKEGQKVGGRVLRVDVQNKKVVVTLKPALVDSKLPVLARVEDAVIGSKYHGVITGVQSYGVFVSFFGDVSGLVPVAECGLPEGQPLQDAFSPGSVVKVRVAGVDMQKNRLKLSLLSKKKAAAVVEVDEGLGGLQPGDQVIGIVTSLHRSKPIDGGDGDGDEEGKFLYAEVGLYPIDDDGGDDDESLLSGRKAVATGRLEATHLSDHPAAAAALAESLKIGSRVDNLLVLQRLETVKQLRVTRKTSLTAAAAAGKLPGDVSEMVEGATYPGYVASVAGNAVFVRFMGELAGRAGLAQLSDTFVSDPLAVFSVGQSVRAQVIQIDPVKGRFTLTLKCSLCGAGDAALLKTYFNDAEVAAVVASGAGEGGTGDDWARDFTLGSCVEGQIHGLRDYGTLIDLTANSDVIGIAAPHQSTEGAPTAKGAPVVGVVLECSRKDGIVDVSLRPELVQRAQELIGADTAAALAPPPTKKKKTKKSTSSSKKDDSAVTEHVSPQLGERVSVTVELLKADEGYAVVSLPPGFSPWLGYLATVDFNQPLSVGGGVSGSGGGGALSGSTTILGQIQPGDVITATVAALPSAETHGRLLFGVPPSADPSTTIVSSSTTKNGAAAAGKSTKIRHPAAGSKVNVKIEAVHALHAEVTLDAGFRGRIYITEVVDDDDAASSQEEDKENPLRKLTAGENVDVVVLGKMQSVEGKRHGLLEFSLRPSLLAAATAAAPESNKAPRKPQQLTWESLKPGQTLPGFAQEVEGEHLWVVVSPSIRGRVFLPQSCTTPQQCASASRLFRPGTPLLVTILAVNSGKHSLDVVLGTSVPAAPRPGSLAVGVVVAVAGSGVQIQLAPGHSGRVALTDIHDVSVKNALQGLKPHQFVKVCVLSDKNSGGGGGADGGGRKKSAPLSGSKRKKEGEADDDDDTRSINAAAAPLTSIFSELSLRPSQGGHCAAHTAAKKVSATAVPPPPSAPLPLADLKPGQRVAGYVKSTGAAGVFVCLSRGVDARIKLRQLSDEFVDNPAGMYPAGSYVEGGVLGVEGGRVELTLRKHRPAPSLQNLEEGQVVRGRVKRIEKFGVFVELDAAQDGGAAAPAGPCGLAHLSELADAFVYDPDRLFKVDQREFYGYCFVRGLFGVIINDEFSLCF